jgi:amidophosphoribosyltransferase
VRFPNVYGIDMPTRSELIAADRTEEEVRREIGADALIYQRLDDLKQAIVDCNPTLTNFDASCFDGRYITGDVTGAYLDHIETLRNAPVAQEEGPRNQLSLAIESTDA